MSFTYHKIHSILNFKISERDVPYLSASSPSIFATIYLSINQSITLSLSLAFSIQLPRHFKATTGIIVLFCGHCVKALDQRGTSALPTYYKTYPPLSCFPFWCGHSWKIGAEGGYIRYSVSADSFLFTPVNLLAGG